MQLVAVRVAFGIEASEPVEADVSMDDAVTLAHFAIDSPNHVGFGSASAALEGTM
jgi:hypothetical protein